MNNKYVKTIEEAKEIWKEIPIGKSINTPGEKNGRAKLTE